MKRYVLMAMLLGFAGNGIADTKAADAAAKTESKPVATMQDYFQVPMKEFKANTFMPAISAEAKEKAIQSMMLANPMSLRDMISMMVIKKQAKEGLTFDEVVESMKLRANYHNFKFVGMSPLYKDVVAISGQPSPRVEIYSFCDAMTAREILDYAPEFAAFLPCRIAVMEDAQGKIWLVTLDWNVKWMDTSPNPNKIPDSLRKRAIEIRDILEDMMTAAANGDL